MKRFLLLVSVIITAFVGAPVFAADAPPIYISAFNAGFKDDFSAQNYDFIELAHTGEGDVPLAGLELRYFNSSGKLAGTLSFSDYWSLAADRVVFGFKNSPQFADFADTPYQYYFSSSGMAATAGMLQLWQDEEKLDEVCWGKLECDLNVSKFSTAAATNFSYLRQSDGTFAPEIYRPEINPEAIIDAAPPEIPSHCGDIVVTEIYSYYADSADEQFIELYNPTEETITLDLCKIRYKTDSFTLSGELDSKQYFAFKDSTLSLTKNPSTFNTVNIQDTSGDIFIDFVYPHGQKKGTSYAVFNLGAADETWLQTYMPTPGAENSYQQFQTCPEDKIINPETGNCIKSQETVGATICPEGKYLNPLTGRCKKIEVATTKICKDGYYLNILTGRCNKIKTTTEASACKDGYERNPDTGRCRKVRTNTAQEYPVAPSSDEEYDSPQIFTAGIVIAVLIVGGAAFAIFQFRKEIKTAILKICRRKES